MTDVKAIIFDLDGTLIDSGPDLHAAANTALVAIGRSELDLKTVLSFVGNGAEALMRRALEATGGSDAGLLRDALAHFLKAYHAQGVRLTRVYPGVFDCLAAIQTTGLPMALCTNKPQGPTEEICAELDLSDYFACMIGAGPKLPRKPDPAPLLAAANALGADPDEVLFVGDSVVDHATAAAAQVRFVLFSGGYINGEIGAPKPFLSFEDWRKGWWREVLA